MTSPKSEKLFDDCIWTVAEYVNQIRKRPPSARYEACCDGSPRNPHIFDTEQEAKDFIRYRAHAARRKLEKQLKLATNQIVKLDKKFGPTSIEQVNELFKRFEKDA